MTNETTEQAIVINPSDYHVPSDEELRQSLNPLSYQVTRQDATERAYAHAYDQLFSRVFMWILSVVSRSLAPMI